MGKYLQIVIDMFQQYQCVVPKIGFKNIKNHDIQFHFGYTDTPITTPVLEHKTNTDSIIGKILADNMPVTSEKIKYGIIFPYENKYFGKKQDDFEPDYIDQIRDYENKEIIKKEDVKLKHTVIIYMTYDCGNNDYAKNQSMVVLDEQLIKDNKSDSELDLTEEKREDSNSDDQSEKKGLICKTIYVNMLDYSYKTYNYNLVVEYTGDRCPGGCDYEIGRCPLEWYEYNYYTITPI